MDYEKQDQKKTLNADASDDNFDPTITHVDSFDPGEQDIEDDIRKKIEDSEDIEEHHKDFKEDSDELTPYEEDYSEEKMK